MELVWSDALKKNKWVIDIFNVFFSEMKNQNIGKASTKFYEVADELNNIVLANKVYQSTRFARALLRGLTAALRNLPTLFNVLAKEHQEVGNITSQKFNNTRAKELEKVMGNLQNGRNLLVVIGFVQILEIFSEVSLEVQYSNHYPIQAWASIDSAKENLANLGEKWSWSTEEMKLSKIGTPQKIIDNIVQSADKVYTPYVSLGAIRNNIKKIDFDMEILLAEDGSKKNIADVGLFSEDEQRELEPAGNYFYAFFTLILQILFS